MSSYRRKESKKYNLVNLREVFIPTPKETIFPSNKEDTGDLNKDEHENKQIEQSTYCKNTATMQAVGSNTNKTETAEVATKITNGAIEAMQTSNVTQEITISPERGKEKRPSVSFKMATNNETKLENKTTNVDPMTVTNPLFAKSFDDFVMITIHSNGVMKERAKYFTMRASQRSVVPKSIFLLQIVFSMLLLEVYLIER